MHAWQSGIQSTIAIVSSSGSPNISSSKSHAFGFTFWLGGGGRAVGSSAANGPATSSSESSSSAVRTSMEAPALAASDRSTSIAAMDDDPIASSADAALSSRVLLLEEGKASPAVPESRSELRTPFRSPRCSSALHRRSQMLSSSTSDGPGGGRLSVSQPSAAVLALAALPLLLFPSDFLFLKGIGGGGISVFTGEPSGGVVEADSGAASLQFCALSASCAAGSVGGNGIISHIHEFSSRASRDQIGTCCDCCFSSSSAN
mmetsp:Transcript_124742/g.216259  ORF Transcript_124742/g.216259 Transcript_124742/m.216259 type:complete len:260 (+) Transcript_124742:79-858(+)